MSELTHRVSVEVFFLGLGNKNEINVVKVIYQKAIDN